MTFVITAGCVDVKDKACLLQCPVDCIYEGERMLYIHPDECIDCGACQPLCPQEAIFSDTGLPEELAPFAEASQEFFADLGSPGSSVGVDVSDRDSTLAAGMPR